MKHKKSIMLFAMLLFWGLASVHAQKDTVTTGGEASGSGGSVSYSVGQVNYIEATGSGGTANQGVQQPYEIFVLGTNDHLDINLDIAVYPNPTVDYLNLTIGLLEDDNLMFSLYDIHGRLLIQQKIGSSTTAIQMAQFPSAIYVLHVFQGQKQLKSFKIIKN